VPGVIWFLRQCDQAAFAARSKSQQERPQAFKKILRRTSPFADGMGVIACAPWAKAADPFCGGSSRCWLRGMETNSGPIKSQPAATACSGAGPQSSAPVRDFLT